MGKLNIRIVQLIDSLEAGGAERMSVNYANALNSKIVFSGIIVSRVEGDLQESLMSEVKYLFLNRKKIIDFKAINRAIVFLKANKIDIIQAHSTSIYFAFLLKLFFPKIQIIWHDHYGKSEFLKVRSSIILKIISVFFKGIIAVNHKLKDWAVKKLNCNNVIYFPNFMENNFFDTERLTQLEGYEEKKIICLANLRPQKNHFLLLECAVAIKKIYPDWSFHLVGKNFNDDYSKKIEEKIKEYNLQLQVYMYGSCKDTKAILQQCQIGVLTSISEGLPLAILEYGLHKLAVVSTSVGEIPSVIQNKAEGILVAHDDKKEFIASVLKLIEDKQYRLTLGANFQNKVIENYSEEKIINTYLKWIYER